MSLYIKVKMDVDWIQVIEKSCGTVRDGVMNEVKKVQTSMYSQLGDQESTFLQQKFTIDRIDRVFKAMTDDVKRHETLFGEIANKFEKQHGQIKTVGNDIDKLNENARDIDLHLSDRIPNQMAAISFEVAKGLVTKKNQQHYF